MRNHLRLLSMILVLLTVVIAIPLAQDNPTVTVTPDSGEVGLGIFEVTADGLTPDETYVIEFVFDGVVIFTSEEVADENGIIVFSAASSEDDEVGTYTVQVAGNDSILAVSEFELTDGNSDTNSTEDTTPTETVGNISITPTSGPISTLHTITLTDLEVDASYTVEIAATRTEEVVYRRIWTSDENGELTIEIFAEDGDTTGQQVVTVFDADGTLIAQSEFTIEEEPERNAVVNVSPNAAPAGREFTITVEGLVAFDNVSVQVVSQDNLLVDTVQARASSAGIATLSILTTDDLDDGTYTVAVFVENERVTESTLTIGEAPVADTDNEETTASNVAFIIEPEAAPIGSVHEMSVTGLNPNQPITLIIENDAGEVEYSKTEMADESGEFSINISSSDGDALGTYPIEISDATTGKVIATAQMVITDGDAPESTGTDTTAQTGTPDIVVEPEAGAIGATHTITLSGMPAGQRIGVVVRSQADDTLALSSVVRVDDNGNGTVDFTSRELNTPGVYTVTAVQPSGDLASTTLTIEGALVSIEPQSAPLGSSHIVTITGLDAEESVTIDVSFEGEVVFSTERVADANGEATLNLSTDETDSTGDYTITIVRESGNQPTAILTATDEEESTDTTETTETPASTGNTQVIDGRLEDGLASIEFSGEEGQYVVVTVASDAFDTAVTIYDTDFFEIGYNDDSRGGTDSLVGPLKLPYNGDYTIEVSESFYVDEAADDAEFVATIQTITISTIEFGEPTAFNISPENPAVYYELPLSAGSNVNVSIDSEGALDTVLQVLYADGSEFAYDDDGGSGLDAELNNLVFTTDGTYLLVVSSFLTDGSGNGTVTVIENPVKSLDEGDVNITLSDKAYTDLAVFEAEEGDVITLNLEKLSGSVEDLYVYATVDGMQVMYYTTMGIPDNLPLMFVMPMSGEVVVTFEEFGYGGGISFNVTLEKE